MGKWWTIVDYFHVWCLKNEWQLKFIRIFADGYPNIIKLNITTTVVIGEVDYTM